MMRRKKRRNEDKNVVRYTDDGEVEEKGGGRWGSGKEIGGMDKWWVGRARCNCLGVEEEGMRSNNSMKEMVMIEGKQEELQTNESMGLKVWE